MLTGAVMGKILGESATIIGTESAAKRLADEHAKTVRDRLLLHHSDMFGYAAAYDNAIILGGYAAFFGLWAGINGDVSPLCRLVTVSLIGMSLLLYIVWQISGMLIRQKGEWQRADVFQHVNDPARFNREWESFEQRNAIAQQRVMTLWPWLFVPQVVLGLSGGLVLTYNALAISTGLPQLR